MQILKRYLSLQIGEMLVPVTAHAAFDKAAELLGMRIRWEINLARIRIKMRVRIRINCGSIHHPSQTFTTIFRHVPVDEVTKRVKVETMARMISSRTVMLVGSAPQFPHGSMDSIQEIAALGVRYIVGQMEVETS